MSKPKPLTYQEEWRRDWKLIERRYQRLIHRREEKKSWCHSPHAQRTKCFCGEVVKLGGAGNQTATCQNCQRVHVKRFGSAFDPRSGPAEEKRSGGKDGCPGVAGPNRRIR